ncbi:MAG: WD40 repeat domain-containing protein [Stappiaceae bacterium]
MPTLAPLDFDAFVVATFFMNDCPVFALGDGTVRFIDGNETSITAHDGALLAAAVSGDAKFMVTGGDDGRVVKVSSEGQLTVLAEQSRKWIDIVALGPRGTVAYASGRDAWVCMPDGEQKNFSHQRAVGGLAFAPKGLRVARARYDGADLFFVSGAGEPVTLPWKGAHKDITFSPDGKYVVTTMQENALHGWRLSDKQDMRMSGYPGKVKSLSWSAKGRYLATSGADAAILWPFSGKTGPMGQQPLQLGARSGIYVTAVACHPTDDVVAVGYADGMVLACRFEDQAEVVLRRQGGDPVSALAWDKAGVRLALGTEQGAGGIVSLAD